MRSGDIPPPLIDINRGIHINGSPEEGFEALIIDRPSASRFNFCKTARRPYDLVVTTVLLRAYLLAPTQFKLSSDGYWDYDDEWVPARELYARIWPGEEVRKPVELD